MAWDRVLDLSNDLGNIYVQRVDWAGRIAAYWPSDGLQLDSNLQIGGVEDLAPDGADGLYVLWADTRDAPTVNGQKYVTHVTSAGSIVPGWPANGLNALVGGPDVPIASQGVAAITPDGSGGIYVSIVDYRNYVITDADIYTQHLLADGTRAPGWPLGGKPAVKCPGEQSDFDQVSDGHGGLFVIWSDGPDAFHPSLHAQHVRADGVVEWDSCGKPLGNVIRVGAVPSRGGAIVVGVVPTPTYQDGVYTTIGFDSTGAIRPEWAGGPLPLVDAPDDQFNMVVVPDGRDGLLAVWDDARNYATTAEDRYIQHVLPDGSSAWTLNGVPVIASPLFDTSPSAHGSDDAMVMDGSGGAYALGITQGNTTPSAIRVGHVDASGAVAAGWSIDGEPLVTTTGGDMFVVCSDEAGGAIAAFEYGYSIVAQHIAPDAPVATQASLVSADATSEGVSLVWYADGGLSQATLERAQAGDGWQAIAMLTPDGTHELSYLDHAVTPGGRYGYRLSYLSGGSLTHSAETWVTVPVAASFALTGAVANPSSASDLSVRFSLASWQPAELALYDLGGRRVWSRDVGSLGPGDHTVRVGEASGLSAGIYWASLHQGGQRASARIAVVP